VCLFAAKLAHQIQEAMKLGESERSKGKGVRAIDKARK
jgi:hypothetical protein